MEEEHGDQYNNTSTRSWCPSACARATFALRPANSQMSKLSTDTTIDIPGGKLECLECEGLRNKKSSCHTNYRCGLRFSSTHIQIQSCGRGFLSSSAVSLGSGCLVPFSRQDQRQASCEKPAQSKPFTPLSCFCVSTYIKILVCQPRVPLSSTFYGSSTHARQAPPVPKIGHHTLHLRFQTAWTCVRSVRSIDLTFHTSGLFHVPLHVSSLQSSKSFRAHATRQRAGHLRFEKHVGAETRLLSLTHIHSLHTVGQLCFL